MNILQLLQAASGSVPIEAPEADAPNDEIVVQGGRPAVIQRDSIRQEVPYVERDPIPANSKSRKELIERKGMFGLKGTMRDIVGILGDAFLTQAGRAPQYAPQREREKLASHLYGFTDNPQAAVERVATEFPEEAIALENQRQQGLARQAAAEVQRAALTQKGYSLLGSLARTIKDDSTYQKARPIIGRMAAQYGLDIGDIPDNYDSNTVGGWTGLGLSVDQGLDNDRADSNAANQEAYRDRQAAVAEGRLAETRRHNTTNEGIARIRANKPAAGRAAPNPTAASIAAPVLAKVARGENLTRGESVLLDRLGMSPDRGQGKKKSRGIPPLPPGFTARKVN